MGAAARLRIAIAVMMLTIAVGTMGYVLVAGMTPFDALYMTITTLATVGYREVQPLGTGGRVFTMFLIVFGVGTTLYLLTAMAASIVEGQIGDLWGRTRMQRRIGDVSNHVVLCGYGRFGRVVAEELRRRDVPTVVVDVDPAVEPELRDVGALYVIGSALADEVLERAGVGRARALVIATPSDSENVFITLAARERRADLPIHARGETDAGLRRLRQAGATQVISAYRLGGVRLANSIVRPAVVDFLEISAPGSGEMVDLEEVRVLDGSPVAGSTIAEVERDHPRLRIVALKRGADAIRLIPESGARLSGGDFLVIIGDRPDLEQLAQECQARAVDVRPRDR